MRSRTAPADMTPPYARETLFLFLAMCLRLYFCVAQRGTCRTKRTNAMEKPSVTVLTRLAPSLAIG